MAERLDRELPLYLLAGKDAAIAYAPGHVVVVKAQQAAALRAALAGDREAPTAMSQASAELKAAAARAVTEWRKRLDAPFSPVCLTVYLSCRCNLRCGYCFALPGGRRDGSVIPEAAVLAAAGRVIPNCGREGMPFHLVLHGGGEPTLEWSRVTRIVELTRAMCREQGVRWLGFLATNGVVTAHRARWLAANLSRVEVSCDGPPDIQERQRPASGARRSSAFVERTARILAEAGCGWEARATITPETVERQAEIVEYCHSVLGARRLRLEPVYSLRGGAPVFQADHAEWFAAEFLKAERRARMLGCELSYSGVRFDELHGPYCSVMRRTLHLLPDGGVTACFFATDSARFPPARIGAWDAEQGQFALDTGRIELRRRMAEVPPHCAECINAYHCARECPERCAVDDGGARPPGFRCELNRKLAEAWILGAAGCRPAPLEVHQDEMDDLLGEAPEGIDPASVRRHWRAATACWPVTQRSLPLPVWGRRGFDHDGDRAWKEMAPLAGCGGPLSIYVHIPFCDRRCGFCDCHSLPLARDPRTREVEFAEVLAREVDGWAAIPGLSRRPVTTVHFGGGTPGILDRTVLAEILCRIRAGFAATEETEWALESTSSLLTHDHLRSLHAMGFRRLHVGVQSLEDAVRTLIGRRQTATAVLEGIERALLMGFTVSADVVVGLPAQTLAGLIDSLRCLAAAGVHGISLYELQISNRNARFLERCGAARDPLGNYLAFVCCDQFLIGRGFSKNHFSHYARAQDANVYYRHRIRNEDLVALGPTADGVLGAYHYRHPEYRRYVGGALLEGGVWETAEERNISAAAAALMGGSLGIDSAAAMGIQTHCRRWLRRGLLAETSGEYMLTANGSWFISAMLDELEREPVTQRNAAEL